jgi:L-aminopeptidase/D-esterase-like protein
MIGIPGATGALAGTPMGGSGSSSHSTDASVTNHIGSIVVQTQATDAKGIASDMGRSMDYLFTSQANAGLY